MFLQTPTHQYRIQEYKKLLQIEYVISNLGEALNGKE